MNEQQRHEMVMETTHPSGAEEWYCPTCGRRLTITWQPWKKIILEPGDIQAAHGGSKGSLKIGPLQIQLGNESHTHLATEASEDDPYLAPWRQWLDNMDWDDSEQGKD